MDEGEHAVDEVEEDLSLLEGEMGWGEFVSRLVLVWVLELLLAEGGYLFLEPLTQLLSFDEAESELLGFEEIGKDF